MDSKASRQPSVLLRPLGALDEKQALMAHEELAQDGLDFLFDRDSGLAWPVYCERLESQRLGVDLSEDRTGCQRRFLLPRLKGTLLAGFQFGTR